MWKDYLDKTILHAQALVELFQDNGDDDNAGYVLIDPDTGLSEIECDQASTPSTSYKISCKSAKQKAGRYL